MNPLPLKLPLPLLKMILMTLMELSLRNSLNLSVYVE
jgi:hypothetical protein